MNWRLVLIFESIQGTIQVSIGSLKCSMVEFSREPIFPVFRFFNNQNIPDLQKEAKKLL